MINVKLENTGIISASVMLSKILSKFTPELRRDLWKAWTNPNATIDLELRNDSYETYLKAHLCHVTRDTWLVDIYGYEESVKEEMFSRIKNVCSKDTEVIERDPVFAYLDGIEDLLRPEKFTKSGWPNGFVFETEDIKITIEGK